MTLQPSKSKLITILAHILAWVVFGIVMFFYHPLFSDIEIPYRAWITQTVTLILLVTAFYVNVSILVPGFLLKNRFGYYVALIIALVAVIVFIKGGVENVLYSHQGLLRNRQIRVAELIEAFLRLRLPGRETDRQAYHHHQCAVAGYRHEYYGYTKMAKRQAAAGGPRKGKG